MDFPIFSSSLSLGKTISQALCTQSLVLLALWAVEKKMALGNEVGKLLLRELSPVKGARSLSFLDMDEDVSFDFLSLILVSDSLSIDVQGTLDILVQRTGSAGHGNFLFIQNNFYFDAFFLKAIGTYRCFIQISVA